MAKTKPVRTLTDDESKVSFKGKTITLKETDNSEKQEKINSLKKVNKIKLLYSTDINNITHWIYEYTK